jgi:hypothetical protein
MRFFKHCLFLSQKFDLLVGLVPIVDMTIKVCYRIVGILIDYVEFCAVLVESDLYLIPNLLRRTICRPYTPDCVFVWVGLVRGGVAAQEIVKTGQRPAGAEAD